MAPGSGPPEFTACASKSDPQRDESTEQHLAVSPDVFLQAAGRHLAVSRMSSWGTFSDIAKHYED
jgi:hypothetical protein